MEDEKSHVGWNRATLSRLYLIGAMGMGVVYAALAALAVWLMVRVAGVEMSWETSPLWNLVILAGFYLGFTADINEQMKRLRMADDRAAAARRVSEAARRAEDQAAAESSRSNPGADDDDGNEGVRRADGAGVQGSEQSVAYRRYDSTDDPPHIAMALILRDRQATTQEKIDAAKAIAELQTADHRRHRLDAVTRIVSSVVAAAALIGAAWVTVSLATSSSDAETPDPLVVVVLTAMPEATGTATPGAE